MLVPCLSNEERRNSLMHDAPEPQLLPGTHESAQTAAPSGNSRREPGSERTLIASPDLVDRASLRAMIGNIWPILAVMLAFVISMLIVPFMKDVPVGDDWVYSRSVEILVNDGRLEILDLSVVTLIFQVFWGSLFSLIFGTSFGAMRLSTLVLVLASAIPMYAMCRELGIRKDRAALGTVLYLFNPLTYVLAFSFMTDAPFCALMVTATYFYVRGFREERPSAAAVIAGSVFAAVAFLIRQQGILIPLAVGIYLVLARRWKFDREGIITAIRVAAIPAVTMVCYYLWLFNTGTPEQQGAFFDEMTGLGWPGTRVLIFRLGFIELTYIGFFLLPLVAGVAWFVFFRRGVEHRNLTLFHWAFLSVLLVGASLLAFGNTDRIWPYTMQYLWLYGLGPQDLVGIRPYLLGEVWRHLISHLVTIATAASLIILFRRFMQRQAPEHASAMLILSIAIWQGIGVLPPSFHFANWTISMDRYFLPLIPLSVGLMLWAIRDIRLSLPVAWIIAGVFAVYSVIGTRDFLVFQEATWDMGRYAISTGIAYEQLDAGASWDGYHLYQKGLDEGITESRSPKGSEWWTDLFAPATDSTYVVSSDPPKEGWTTIAQLEYSSWLHRDPQYLYLLQRPPEDESS